MEAAHLPTTDAPTVERVPWTEALRRMDWRQGEHVTAIGPTGAGKTELLIALAATRRWNVFLNTKRFDSTQHRLRRELGFRTTKDGAINPEIAQRWIVTPPWPKVSAEELDTLHREVFVRALTSAFWQRAWTMVIDELEFINRDLRIDAPVNKLLRQGRSQGNSMVLGTQRPRHVTLHAYEQATHLFIWRQSDFTNIARAAELAGVNRVLVLDTVPDLGRHDVLYVNTITGETFITNTRWE